jgi:hypothetical protein
VLQVAPAKTDDSIRDADASGAAADTTTTTRAPATTGARRGRELCARRGIRFARCMRANGVPAFDDPHLRADDDFFLTPPPTSGDEETQIEAAGVNLRSSIARGDARTALSDGTIHTEEEVNGHPLVDWVARLIEVKPGRRRALHRVHNARTQLSCGGHRSMCVRRGSYVWRYCPLPLSIVAAGPSRSRARVPVLRRGSVVVAAVLAVTVVAGMAAAFASGRDLPRVLPTEDGVYSLAVARHIGLGDGITADGISRTNGFQPLWSFLTAPLYALVGGDRIAGLRLTHLLGTLLWLAFAGLLALHTRDVARRHRLRGDVAAIVALVVALGSVSVFRLFHNGLETGLLLVLVCGAVLVLDRIEVWTPRRVVGIGLLLGAVAWARLDGLAFVAAVGVATLVGAAGRRRWSPAPLVACAIAAVVLLPWLLYGLWLDGHLVPSGGRAEALGSPDVHQNTVATIRVLGGWVLAPGLRPFLHPGQSIVTAIAVVGIIVLLGAIAVVVRRAGSLRLGTGTAALWICVAFLIGYYTLVHGAWWFQDRYLSAMLILAVPWLAGAIEALIPRRALPALALVVAALNLPLFVVLLGAPRTPPAWADPGANTGTHPNLNWDQTTWALQHVRPDCRIGAIETGTMIYFRPNTLNLDGKVNRAALEAQVAGRLPAYVDRARIDVLLDIESGIADATRGWDAEWAPARRLDDRFWVTTRRGREGCVQ